MNEFNQKLDQARRKQKRSYFSTALAGVLIFICISTLFIGSRGTRIDILPTEIKDTAKINVTKGLGFHIGESVYTLASTPEITVSAPGFTTAQAQIDSVHLGKVFQIELIELPGELSFKLSNNDNDLSLTTWRIDGDKVALSDKLEVDLKAGVHIITIDNQFYEQYESKITIQRGERIELTARLQPVSGSIEISSIPTGAPIFINNAEQGITPIQLSLQGGRHTLQIQAKNYQNITEVLEIRRSQPKLRRSYQLKPRKATADFNLTPKGGTLLVDGVLVTGSTLLNATVEHHIVYMKDGYYPQSQEITLQPEERRTISFNLKQEIGTVKITSSPASMIWIGNKKYGTSPITLKLQAINQKITFNKTGYRSVSKNVTPKGNSIQNVSVTLLPEYEARLKEAPQVVTNQSGIKLKLFLVQGSFTMGASRSEKGQRANEFQRKVELNKPFYASVHEITNSQFAKFNPRKTTGPAQNPVTSVSWYEAAAYCNWLSKNEKLPPFYIVDSGQIAGFDPESDGYRLLSEPEWEWLARKSGKKQQTLFTWGNETTIPSKAANIADESAQGQNRYYVPNYNDGFSGIAPVGSLAIEPSGIYDMAGNVSEWIHDVYSLTPVSGQNREVNPLGHQQGQAHVVKGANWRSGTITTLRPAFRDGLTNGRDDVGFRVARYLYGKEND